MAAATVAMGEGVREAVWRPSILYRANVYTHTHTRAKKKKLRVHTDKDPDERASGIQMYRCDDATLGCRDKWSSK